MSKVVVPDTVKRLVETFDRNLDSYHSSAYNETQLRRDFLDPFFETLGWDVANKKGYDQRYREVVHEDAIKVGGTTKAPDYCFRIGGVRKFFVEAKAPARDIARDPAPAFQLRRYAWTAKLPLSILTDFEEFSVYDTRTRPAEKDKAGIARLRLIPFREYEDVWEELVGTFSPDAILQGAFDKYAESGKKRGTTPVDAEFLKDIERWRDVLARNIALRNPRLTNRQLNQAVQRTIDRIIFLRICEDRGIEPAGGLQALTNGTRVYPRLFERFRRADDRYNSGLFHFTTERGREEPDDLTPSLRLDDTVLKSIIAELYYPSPYEFSVFPADILGHVYEQFLGKVIRLTPGHRAKVEEKPEVRKAGGVYYTPTYIVDYIVKNTVGKLLDGEGSSAGTDAGSLSLGRERVRVRVKKSKPLTPAQASKLRILDPACGSGSFLLGAFQYLLDWHRDRYIEDGPAKHRKELYEGPGGEWRLTTQEKKRILLNNIYGVDIDSQAVEVTKLSLLLKVLEGESDQTISLQLKMFRERALPDLSSNIKCGNSLIGSDFWQGEQQALFEDEEERLRINAFDWDVEFPEVFGHCEPKARQSSSPSGGFDAVIGNPPWGADIDQELGYFHRKYPASTQEHTDSYKLFIDAALKLAKREGFVSLIVPNTLLRQRRIKDVRVLLLENALQSVVDLGEDVFDGVVAPSCIFVVAKTPASDGGTFDLHNASQTPSSEKADLLREGTIAVEAVSVSDVLANADLEFVRLTLGRVATAVQLGALGDIACRDAGINYQRVNVGMREKGKSDLAQRLLYEGKRRKSSDQMYWKGSDIGRYWIAPKTNRYCRTNYRDFIRPNEVVHLNKETFGSTPKILIRQTADHIIGTIDYRGIWFGRSVVALVPTVSSGYRIEYFLGILNSLYIEYVYHKFVAEKGRVFAQVKLAKVKQLPIRTIDFSDEQDRARHNRMVELVEGMLDLHKKLPKAKGAAKTTIERQIAATDKQIDALVYELYGLTDREVRIVEESTSGRAP